VERLFLRTECDDADDVDYDRNINVDDNSDGYGSGGDDIETIRN
jgi:hypothetical protein